MFFKLRILSLFVTFLGSQAHHQHESELEDGQVPLAGPHSTFAGPTWGEKYGAQFDQAFSGPLSFSHLPYVLCLEDTKTSFDIAILGMPFDTAVTYRPG